MADYITDTNKSFSAERQVHHNNRNFGAWTIVSLIVSFLTLGVLLYTVLFDARARIDDTRDKTTQTYTVTGAQTLTDAPDITTE